MFEEYLNDTSADENSVECLMQRLMQVGMAVMAPSLVLFTDGKLLLCSMPQDRRFEPVRRINEGVATAADYDAVADLPVLAYPDSIDEVALEVC